MLLRNFMISPSRNCPNGWEISQCWNLQSICIRTRPCTQSRPNVWKMLWCLRPVRSWRIPHCQSLQSGLEICPRVLSPDLSHHHISSDTLHTLTLPPPAPLTPLTHLTPSPLTHLTFPPIKKPRPKKHSRSHHHNHHQWAQNSLLDWGSPLIITRY